MAARTVSILGGNWNATATWVGGVVPIAGDTVDFTATSGNLTVNVTTAALAGINFTNYVSTITFNANISVNTSVNLGTGGYIQAGSGAFGLQIGTSTTITSNGVSWNNTLSFVGNTATYTLADNLTVTGNIVMSGTSSNIFTNSTLYIGGNLTISSTVTVSGTTIFNFNGTGTWSHPSSGVIRTNVTIDTIGTLTLGTNIYYNTGTLTYTSGTVITTGSTLNIANTTTLDTNGITWNNVSFTFGTTTLTSDLNCQNLIINCNSTPQINLKNIYVSGNLQIDGTNFTQGTTEIILIGNGTWSNSSNGTLNIDLTINTSGTIKLGTNIHYAIKTLTYINGKVNTKGSTLNLFAPAILINCHKINFDKVIIGISGIITMNEFFSGSPAIVTNIKSSNTVNNFTIAFQNGFEKIAKFVDINNCTLSKPLQLLVITNSPRSSTNTRGIRYINQSPNGIPKGNPSIQNQTTFGASGLLSDPNMR
jgi:hypothetical protein